MQSTRVEPGKGIAWYGSGWRIFMVNPVIWVVMAAIFLVIAVILMFIPFLGPLIFWLIEPALIAGLMYAASEAQADRPIEIGYLFKGLTGENKRNPLLILGVFVLIAGILITLIVSLVMGGSMGMGMFTVGADGEPAAVGAGIVVAVLLTCVLSFLVFMAMIFAVPLVMFNNTPPVDALKESFHTSVANILPLLIFAIVYFVLHMIAWIPFGLGFLLLIPVATAALYAAYQDVYPLTGTGTASEEDVMIVE